MGAIARTGNPPTDDAAILGLTDFVGAFMWQADPVNLDIKFVTKGVVDLTGHDVSEWLGGPERWGLMIDPEDRDGMVRCMYAVAADGRDREVEFRVAGVDGSTIWLRDAVRLVDDGSGSSELWGLGTVITAEKLAEAELHASNERYERLTVRTAELKRQSLLDALTGLPNRILLDDRLETALRSTRRSGASCGVLLIDLDRFKEINDTDGHRAGDEVLRQVALRFRVSLRAQDTPARIGGDEFVAVLPDTDAEGAVRAAQRILRAFVPPIEAEGHSYQVGLSIGIAIHPMHGDTAEELLGRADAAMYHVKENGGGFGLSLEDEGVRAAGPRTRRGRRRRRAATPRRFLQMFVGAAAGLLLVVAAMAPAVRHPAPSRSTAQLDAAASKLEHAPEGDVPTAVEDVEEALADISWKEVGGTEMVASLDRLERLLAGLTSYASTPLSDRMERLITEIRKARAVAQIAAGERGSVSLSAPGSVGSTTSTSTTAAPPTAGPLVTSIPGVELPPLRAEPCDHRLRKRMSKDACFLLFRGVTST